MEIANDKPLLATLDTTRECFDLSRSNLQDLVSSYAGILLNGVLTEREVKS